jgi:hypothetical protein
MRTHARSLSALASALLLAASAATLSGCGKTETSPPPQNTAPPKFQSRACTTGSATVVTVFVEDVGEPKARTRNKTVYVCERDSVEWVPADPETYVREGLEWTNGSPFLHEPKHETHGKRKVLKSESPKTGTAGKRFDYHAWLVLKDGTTKEVDPIIEVME